MNTMLAVTDMDKTIEFYKRVLGLGVVMDFGANKTLTSTRLRNIRGDSVWFASMTRTGILSKWSKI